MQPYGSQYVQGQYLAAPSPPEIVTMATSSQEYAAEPYAVTYSQSTLPSYQQTYQYAAPQQGLPQEYSQTYVAPQQPQQIYVQPQMYSAPQQTYNYQAPSQVYQPTLQSTQSMIAYPGLNQHTFPFYPQSHPAAKDLPGMSEPVHDAAHGDAAKKTASKAGKSKKKKSGCCQ